MGKRHKFPVDVESNSSSTSSSDDTSADKAKRRKRRNRSSINARKTEDKDIIRMLAQLNDEMRKQSMQLTETKDDTSEMRRQLGNLIESQNGQSKELEKLIESQNGQSKELEKLTASHNDLRKQLEFHTNITGHAESDAPRSQMNQVQTPRYQLVFRSAPIDKIEKGKTIEISVALVEGISDRPVENGPLASATVELVVVNAEFNQHDNQYNWSKEDFECNITKPRRGNSATGYVDQSVKSIVSNGRFNLVQGARCYSGSAIFDNSHNKKVRLGVMVVSPTEERVLEGLSKPFYVRGHDRPGRQSNLCHNSSNRQRSNIIGGQSQLPVPENSNMLTEPSTSQEQQSSLQQYQHELMLAQTTYNQNGQAPGDNEYQEQNSSIPNLQQPSAQTGPIRSNIIGGQSQPPFLGNPNMLSTATEPSTSQEQQSSLQQYQHVLMMLAQATNNQNRGELASEFNNLLGDMSNNHDLCHAIDIPFPRTMPLQLVWDRPNVGPSKREWNLLDQLMPLLKFNNCGLPTKRLMQEHLGSWTIISKEVMQACRNIGVTIEPLEPDDSDEERQLKRKMRSKYHLRFVNKVCEAYHIMDPIKADDGSLLKVALFDGNRKITNGPLSSASVQIIILHGDFNEHGQDYWTSEEFNHYEVCPQPGQEASSVLGGDCILVLSDGEACLGDAFFQMTSYCARTGKFKMGVRLANAQEERIQEGVSEPFWVKDRRYAGECRLGMGPEDDSAKINHPSVVQDTMAELVTGPLLYTLKNKASSYRYNVMEGMENVLADGTFLAHAEDPDPPVVETGSSEFERLEEQIDVLLGKATVRRDIADAVEEADGKLKEIDERRRRYGPDGRVAMATPAATPSSSIDPCVAMVGEGDFNDLKVLQLCELGRPAMARSGGQDDSWEYSLRKYLLLLAMLVATVTYGTGLNPPGGVWQAVGAYSAGSCREIDTTIYVSSLVGAVIVFILVLAAIVKFCEDAIEQRSLWKLLTRIRDEVSRWLPDTKRCCLGKQSNQEPNTGNANGSVEQQQTQALERASSLVMLLATLAAGITYQAGLNPPGGLWEDDDGSGGGRYMAGDPIMLTTNPRRYKAFYYCNSVAFVASLVAILLVRMKTLHHRNALKAAMILDLLGLIGAYAAGSCRDVSTSIYAVALVGTILVSVVSYVVFLTLDHEDGSPGGHDGVSPEEKKAEELLEKRRKRLLLFAILAATITYQAVVTRPGGFMVNDDGRAGYPVRLSNYPRRYTAFFYCNSVSFMLSIAFIILLVNPNLYRPAIRSNALYVCTAAGLIGIMGGYAAGCTQHLKTSIYIFALAALVLSFVVVLVAVFFVMKHLRKQKDKYNARNSSNTADAAAETPVEAEQAPAPVSEAGQVGPKKKLMHKDKWWLRVLNTTIVLDLLGLLIAYAAGSRRSWKTTGFVSALVVAVLAYFAIHVVLSCLSRRRASPAAISASSQPNEEGNGKS